MREIASEHTPMLLTAARSDRTVYDSNIHTKSADLFGSATLSVKRTG